MVSESRRRKFIRGRSPSSSTPRPIHRSLSATFRSHPHAQEQREGRRQEDIPRKPRRLFRHRWPTKLLHAGLCQAPAMVGAGFALAGGVWWIAVLFAAVLGFVYWPVVIEEESHLRDLFPAFAQLCARARTALLAVAHSACGIRGPLPDSAVQTQPGVQCPSLLLGGDGITVMEDMALMSLEHGRARKGSLLCLSVFLPCLSVFPQVPFSSGETTDFDIAWRVFGAGTARMSVAEVPGAPRPLGAPR